MKNYRLKKEAVPFMKGEYATLIKPYHIWDKRGIDINALEEVQSTYLTYGHRDDDETTCLSGWGKDGANFRFTIHFPSATYAEYCKESMESKTRELMDIIQDQVNKIYNQ